MLQRYLVLEQAHVVMIALEAVLHDKQVHAYFILLRHLSRSVVTHLADLGLTDLVCVLDFLNEVWIGVDAVALFKDDGADLGQGLFYALGLNLELGCVHVKHVSP